MFSKVNILKYSAVLIVFVAGIFLTLSGNPLSKARSADDSTAVSVPDTSPAPATVNANDTASVTSNAVTLKAEVQAAALKSELNNYVLKVIPLYDGGKYPYLLNNDYANYNGVTENIIYQGSLIAKANPDGSKSSHCVGLTYEVFFKAMKERNKEAGISSDNFNNMTIDNMKDFLLTWYVAQGNSKLEGNQLAGAIVKFGLGIQITSLENAKAGDFIDFSRTKSGHTAVFINWLRDEKYNIVGLKYWSTQDSTNGIGYREEYFSDNLQVAFKGTVNRNQLYIGRVGPIASYKAF
jgi:hypothetical protein